MADTSYPRNEKRVAHLLSGPYLTGSSDWIYQQINNHHRFEPYVYCFGTKNLEQFPVSHLRSFNLFRRQNFLSNSLRKYDPALPVFLFYDQPKILHSHFGMAGYDFLHLKLLYHLPMMTSFYGLDISAIPKNSLIWKKRYQFLFKIGEGFLVQGEYMKSALRNLGCPVDKIFIHRLGVDLSVVKYQPPRNDSTKIRILAAGRFIEKKGFPDAITAVGLLKKADPKTSITLTIIGKAGNSPDQQTEKKKMIYNLKKYHLERTTKILDFQPFAAFVDELSKHDIFLSPSVLAHDGDNEGGSPMTILEASAAGLPVVSTYHCDIPEAVINAKSGFLVPEHRPDLLAKNLYLLATKPRLRSRFGLAGRRHIEANYNAEKQNSVLEDIYKEVLRRFPSV